MASYPTQPAFQGTTTVVAQPVQSGPVVLQTAPQHSMNVSVIKGLGITQIVFGVLSICFGIGAIAGFSKLFWLTESGGGIWGGLWILVTGIIGVCSAFRPTISALNGTHMAFCIIATVVSFIDGIFFAAGIAYYNNCRYYGYNYGSYNYGSYNYGSYSYYGSSYYSKRYQERHDCNEHADAGRAIYSILLIIMVAEFFVALVAAIYCCQATNCCRGTPSRGVIIQQAQQPQYIVTSSTGQTFMTPAYPQHPGVATQQYSMAPQMMVQQPPIIGHPGVATQQYSMAPQMMVQQSPTNVAYSEAYKTAPPPAYTE